MKITAALTACNNNSYYYNLFPIVFKAWKKCLNIPCYLIFIGNSIPESLNEYKEYIILFKPIENISDIYQAQVIRILYPSLLNETTIITDIDILPINPNYYKKYITDIDDKFIVYTTRYLKQEMIAICYVCGSMNMWKQINNINNVDDIRNFLINNYNINYRKDKGNISWYSDQKILFKLVKNINNIKYFNDKDIEYKRLNLKGTLKLNLYIKNKTEILNNLYSYSDIHIMRSYSKSIEFKELINFF